MLIFALVGIAAARRLIAPIARALIGVVVALDLWSSHGEWRRIFIDETPDPALTRPRTSLRPPAATAAAAPAPGRGFASRPIRGLVMRRVTFRQWVYYKFTLRIDYLANDLWRGAAHVVRKALLRRGVRGAHRWARLYQPHWSSIPRQIAEHVLETSLMLGLAETWTDATTGNPHGRFVFTDWVCPAGPRFRGEAVHIDRFEIVLDMKARVATGAKVNGVEIGPGEDALVIADLCVSTFFHTIMHGYANWACVPEHTDPILSRAAVYTLAMNAQAWQAGYFSNVVASNFRRVIQKNATRGIFPHGSGALMREIVQHSRTGAFLMEARRVTMEVMRAHAVDIDHEAFFLMSVMHSIDHHFIAATVDPCNLRSRLLDYDGTEWIRVLFQEPLHALFANTKISAVREGWIAELYRRLRAIDPWYADMIDYCIRY
jgi:hypothetical protein